MEMGRQSGSRPRFGLTVRSSWSITGTEEFCRGCCAYSWGSKSRAVEGNEEAAGRTRPPSDFRPRPSSTWIWLLRYQIPQPVPGLTFTKAKQSPIPQLANPLAGDTHHPPDLFQGPAVAVLETKV